MTIREAKQYDVVRIRGLDRDWSVELIVLVPAGLTATCFNTATNSVAEITHDTECQRTGQLVFKSESRLAGQPA